MKYLKVSLLLFLISIILFTTGGNAKTISIYEITIPTFSKVWSSSVHTKETFSEQSVKKIKCTDNVSGDGRVIMGATSSTDSYLGSGEISSWIEVGYSYTSWGSEHSSPADYRLKLYSKKSLITTATFTGTWKLDS